MVLIKRKDVTKQGFCKCSQEKSASGKSLISIYSIFLEVGGEKGLGWGWVLI